MGFAYIVPSDVGCPGMDATPDACPEFQDIVTRVLAYQGNPVPLQAQTSSTGSMTEARRTRAGSR